jgi:hypothetical protein
MRASAVVQTPYGSHRVAHPTHLAPHRPAQSPSRRHRCRRWPALTRPFHPSPVPYGHRRVYSLLPSCVVAPLPAPRPRLLFRGVAFRIANCRLEIGDCAVSLNLKSAICNLQSGRGVGKFLWRFAPAAARHQPSAVIIAYTRYKLD